MIKKKIDITYTVFYKSISKCKGITNFPPITIFPMRNKISRKFSENNTHHLITNSFFV